MTSNSDVAVIVPLFNEASVIGGVIKELLSFFPTVYCIDDGSSDGSAAIAHLAGATVLEHPYNLGQGAALQTGFTYALRQPGIEYVVSFDSDGQHRPADAAGMVQKAKDESLSIIFGSRFLDDRSNPSKLKILVLKVATHATNLSTGLKLTDAHNGLRVIRRDALVRIELKQNRMAHGTEIVQQLSSTGLPWGEFPVQVLYTDYSKAKGQSVWNSVNILFDLIFK
jgi:glycosyltransferase involved in cell wall biosynthesis